MRKILKRTRNFSIIIMIFSMLAGCIEAYIYPVITVFTVFVFMVITQIGHFTAGYSQSMLSKIGNSTAKTSVGYSPVQTVIIPPLGRTLAVLTITLLWRNPLLFNGFTLQSQRVNSPQGDPDNNDKIFKKKFLNVSPDSIGTYRIVQTNGTIRRTSDIIATSNTSAYIDLNDSGAYDPEWEPQINYNDQTTLLTLSFPPYGGGAPGSLGYDIPDYGVLELNSGIFTFPAAGKYTADWTFTSVDPDTGGANNGNGDAPLVKAFTTHVDVVEIASTQLPLSFMQLLLKKK